jgi:DNA-binding beta-propeller fold protein YncE
VQVFAADGAYRGALRPQALVDENWQPAALAVDAAGDVYVTDFADGKHRVVVLNARGELKAQYGGEGTGSGELSFPNGLAVGGDGRVYVTDSNNSRIQALDPQSGSLAVVAAARGLNLPRGLAVVGDRLYLADTIGQRVLAYELAAGELRFLYALGDEGLADGMFRYPEGLAADRTGRIYVADRVNNRVQVFGYR